MSTALAVQGSPDMMGLLQIAIEKESAIDVIERLRAMQIEDRTYHAEVAFNEAMHRCQDKMKPVIARVQGDKGKYADYEAVDAEIRPIYTADGFSLSFSEKDCPIPEYIRLICYVSHVQGHTRTYQKDWPIVTKGPKGNDVMTPTHAHGAADSYAKRYMVKDIFNVVVGREDNDGGGGPQIEAQDFIALADSITNASNDDELGKVYRAAAAEALRIGDKQAIVSFMEKKAKRKKELSEGK